MRSEKRAQIKQSRFDRIEGDLILTNLKLSIHNTRNGQRIVLQTSDIHEQIAISENGTHATDTIGWNEAETKRFVESFQLQMQREREKLAFQRRKRM